MRKAKSVLFASSFMLKPLKIYNNNNITKISIKNVVLMYTTIALNYIYNIIHINYNNLKKKPAKQKHL